MINFAQAGCDRSHHGLRHTGGQRNLAQPLVNLLAGEVDVDVVGEDRDDLGEPEFRDRADFLQTFETAKREFDGIGDQPLDFLGREGGCDGVDLDLVGRRVGEGVERELLRRVDTRDHEQGGQE